MKILKMNKLKGIVNLQRRHCRIYFQICQNNQKRMLISWERTLKITDQIWTYLDDKGRQVD